MEGIQDLTICNSQLKWNYQKNEKLFLKFLFHFWNLHQILNSLKKKMIVIANIFPKLQTLKIFLKKLSQDHRFRPCVRSQHVKPSQLLAESPWEHFSHVLSSFSGKLIWNMSPLVLGEILEMFVDTLTAAGKYPVQGCENLQREIQMQLSEKQKSFCELFVHFWILHQILNILKKKMIVIANVFPKLQTVKTFVRKLSQEHRFRTCFDSEHVKASQILAKCPWECFYHVLYHSQKSWFGKCLV